MVPDFSAEEIDDLLYFARTNEISDFTTLIQELSKREDVGLNDALNIIRDEYTGNGPLHMAAANGHSELISETIKYLSTPPQNPQLLSLLNQKNLSGNTPLHYACINGHLESVKALVDNGADPTITNAAGHDPVYEAERNDRKEVVEWVLKEGGEGLMSGLGNAEGEGEVDDDDADDAGASSETDEPKASGIAGIKEELDPELKAKLAGLGFEEDKNV